MKKIPVLFERIYNDFGRVCGITREVRPGMEWVLDGSGDATVKWDGTATMYKDCVFYKRYDAKHGKPVPENAIKCQDEADPITGHLPCWVPVDENDPGDRWILQAMKNYIAAGNQMENWTYEAVGPHINSSPYDMEEETLIPHGREVIEVERSFDGIKKYLEDHYIEGIVFWKDGEPKCKIRRKDFGLFWKSGKKKIKQDTKQA